MSKKDYTKLHNNATMQNGYFKEERFQNPNIRFTSLERLSLTFTADGKNKTFAVCLQLPVQ